MTSKNPTYVARCRCGAVEIGGWGDPLAVNACYCDDCQAAARRLDSLGNAAPVANADGGTEFMLFRRDRIACIRGAEHLEAMRLTDSTKTRRMITTCCGTPMYMAFDDGRPWVSAFRAGFGPDAPSVQRRICTRFKPPGAQSDGDLPSYPGYPVAMFLRIFAAAPLMLLSRPVGVLP